ncbi:Non-catalytic module family DOC2, partial [Piromyces sp. E2]
SCWSEPLGYGCCHSSCHVYVTDEDGEWGYERDKWCGIPPSCKKNKCWSEKFGYPCCSSCDVYNTDENGKWGYEDGHWCGIFDGYCNN